MRRLLSCLCWLLLWSVAANAAANPGSNCRVVAVLDGDTLQCLAGLQRITVRLGQIDAPEKAQPYGQRAKYALAARVFGREVRLERQETDKYGRRVARVWLGEVDINRQQVSDGWAWVYRQYAREAAYYAAERSARAGRAGLWADARPVAPWDWRRGERVGRTLPAEPAEPAQPAKQPAKPAPSAPSTPATGNGWQCGAKSRCSQMQSCEEARFHLQVCGQSRLDANRDGTPCEALCR